MADEAGGRALGLILKALDRYPDPLPVEVDPTSTPPRFAYVSPLAAAVALYGARFQKTSEEGLILEAFAAAASKVFERCRAHIAASMNAIVDGGRGRELRREYMTLIGELGGLAAVLTGTNDQAYLMVCEAIIDLMHVSPE